ncbi:alpha-N-acetylglucosaminidase N-terminal domain-containing protein [Asticcacaulis sp. DXS10W]|uniref:Alpha-N-acetylglucosaminidase N-terminal domain-containing protein n=2 Tax=Asticcacaulis TaxID=76890 RepID=A0ABT5IDA7_9CAUL|nr:alpha-N-acetylglucosaminidase N-terminal domain-containing protein [Asticcacaulis currens]MDC7694170.1 alpha-N-acetylglucosaminidase N-terminal domain-containing protein [Asticcacaulis currens]
MPALSRRTFLSTSIATATTLGLAPALHAATAPSAAQAVLKRFLGRDAARIRLSLDPSGALPWYATTTTGGQVTIRGNSPVALTHGA